MSYVIVNKIFFPIINFINYNKLYQAIKNINFKHVDCRVIKSYWIIKIIFNTIYYIDCPATRRKKLLTITKNASNFYIIKFGYFMLKIFSKYRTNFNITKIQNFLFFRLTKWTKSLPATRLTGKVFVYQKNHLFILSYAKEFFFFAKYFVIFTKKFCLFINEFWYY